MDEILQCEIRNLWNVLQTGRLNCCCCCCWGCSLVANANRPPGWEVNSVAAGGVYILYIVFNENLVIEMLKSAAGGRQLLVSAQ